MLDTHDTFMPYLFPPKETSSHSQVGSLSRTKIRSRRSGHFGDTLPTHPLEAP
jgi:hypothetical protein